MIEDTTTDRDELAEQFGERVAQYVALLSKDKRLEEQQREIEYVDRLAKAPLEVQLCKLADMYDNLVDVEGQSRQRRDRLKTKAKRLIELFAPGFPDQWRPALEAVRAKID